MKVRELMHELLRLDQESIVVIAHDADTSEYRPALKVTANRYVERTSWYGTLAPEGDPTRGRPCVTLWPMD